MIAMMSSCGVFKRTNKTLDKREQSSVTRSDSLSKSDINRTTKDKGVVIDEVVTVTEKKKPATKTKVKGSLDHGTNILTDSLGREFIAIFDTLSKVVEVSIVLPEETETTTRKEKRTENKDTEKKEVIKQTANVRDEQKISVRDVRKESESKPDYTWIWYIVFAVVVVYVLFKRRLL